MTIVPEVQIGITSEDTEEASLSGGGSNQEPNANDTQPPNPFQNKSLSWWLRMTIYTVCVLAGQSVATLLGRLYYNNGGDSKWMETLVQVGAFPILIPCYFFTKQPKPPPTTTNATTTATTTTTTATTTTKTENEKTPSVFVLASIYIAIGLLFAGDSMLYSLGLLYLPVSTYSLVCATQLAFNALFSYFLNSQKFTVFVVNSLVLLTISSALLVFQDDNSESSSDQKIPKEKHPLGFICTITASAGYSLVLSLTQLAFDKVIKKETFKVILDMIVYQSFVATCAICVGLFASGEWKTLRREMEEFRLGKTSYLMNLIWTAVCWQFFNMGSVGLILEVSSLFANVIGTLSMPIVPVLAVVVFHDEMNGIKLIAMMLAIWGFASYVYQHYLDEHRPSAAEAADGGTTYLEDRSEKAA